MQTPPWAIAIDEHVVAPGELEMLVRTNAIQILDLDPRDLQPTPSRSGATQA